MDKLKHWRFYPSYESDETIKHYGQEVRLPASKDNVRTVDNLPDVNKDLLRPVCTGLVLADQAKQREFETQKRKMDEKYGPIIAEIKQWYEGRIREHMAKAPASFRRLVEEYVRQYRELEPVLGPRANSQGEKIGDTRKMAILDKIDDTYQSFINQEKFAKQWPDFVLMVDHANSYSVDASWGSYGPVYKQYGVRMIPLDPTLIPMGSELILEDSEVGRDKIEKRIFFAGLPILDVSHGKVLFSLSLEMADYSECNSEEYCRSFEGVHLFPLGGRPKMFPDGPFSRVDIDLYSGEVVGSSFEDLTGVPEKRDPLPELCESFQESASQEEQELSLAGQVPALVKRLQAKTPILLNEKTSNGESSIQAR